MMAFRAGEPVLVDKWPPPPVLFSDPWVPRRWRVEDAINSSGDAMVTLQWDWPPRP